MAVDIGAGDGRFVYESARRASDWLFIGVDANYKGLIHHAVKVKRKPAKGGLGNALYVRAAVEALPPELDGVAQRVSIIFPWGSLLHAAVGLSPNALSNVRRICQPEATLEIVLAYHANLEPSEVARLGLPDLSLEYVQGDMAKRYRAAGFRVTGAELLSREMVRRLPSTWARRFAYGRSREVWRVVAEAVEG